MNMEGSLYRSFRMPPSHHHQSGASSQQQRRGLRRQSSEVSRQSCTASRRSSTDSSNRSFWDVNNGSGGGGNASGGSFFSLRYIDIAANGGGGGDASNSSWNNNSSLSSSKWTPKRCSSSRGQSSHQSSRMFSASTTSRQQSRRFSSSTTNTMAGTTSYVPPPGSQQQLQHDDYHQQQQQQQWSASDRAQLVSQNSALHDLLAIEVEKAGVVTAGGYKAVHRQFLYSEAVERELKYHRSSVTATTSHATAGGGGGGRRRPNLMRKRSSRLGSFLDASMLVIGTTVAPSSCERGGGGMVGGGGEHHHHHQAYTLDRSCSVVSSSVSNDNIAPRRCSQVVITPSQREQLLGEMATKEEVVVDNSTGDASSLCSSHVSSNDGDDDSLKYSNNEDSLKYSLKILKDSSLKDDSLKDSLKNSLNLHDVFDGTEGSHLLSSSVRSYDDDADAIANISPSSFKKTHQLSSDAMTAASTTYSRMDTLSVDFGDINFDPEINEDDNNNNGEEEEECCCELKLKSSIPSLGDTSYDPEISSVVMPVKKFRTVEDNKKGGDNNKDEEVEEGEKELKSSTISSPSTATSEYSYTDKCGWLPWPELNDDDDDDDDYSIKSSGGAGEDLLEDWKEGEDSSLLWPVDFVPKNNRARAA